MEKYLNLWDLEKIARQYLGFNDQVVNEYHKRFEMRFDRLLFLKPTAETGDFCMLILHWRSITSVKHNGFGYIYTFRDFIRPGQTCTCDVVVSLPRVLFEDNVYRASVLK